jgi:WhiB family redox-sensing transcriptional regulator
MHRPAKLGSVSDTWAWQGASACRGMDTEIFYAADFARGAPKRKAEAEAKAICAECPVTEQCLTRAIQIGEPHGIWGGLNPEERLALTNPDRGFAA